MISLIGRRLLLAFLTLFPISPIVFLRPKTLPGKKAIAYPEQKTAPESFAALREKFGFADPIHFNFERKF
jgi:ABC-type dipeptide/oligopeptide/nickel transport system permease component